LADKSLPGTENQRERWDWRARAFVIAQGKDGHEHVYCYCARRFCFLAKDTSGKTASVALPAKVVSLCKMRSERVVVHHNHPGGAPLSLPDIRLLGTYPGLAKIIVHTQIGSRFSACRTGHWRTSWIRRLEVLDNAFALQSMAMKWPSPSLELHAFNLLLDKSRLINYEFVLDRGFKAHYTEYQMLVNNFVAELVSSLI
jgi:hypothetical protein